MNTDIDSCHETLRVGFSLTRWRTLMLYRKGAHRIRTTLLGKIEVVAVFILTSMLAPNLVVGFFETLPETAVGMTGLLFAGHLWLALTVTLMILVQLTKAFLKDREAEPLVAHPGLSPALNLCRAFTAIPLATLIFTGLFLVYFMQPIAARLDRLWIALPAFLTAVGLLAIASAAAIGYFGRILLRTAIARGFRNERTIHNAVGAAAIGTFSLVLLGIIIASKHAHGLLEALGASIAVSIPIGMIPFAAALAADEGRWLAAIGWLGLSAALALWAVRATYRWSFSAHREIPMDLATPVQRVFAPAFTGRRGRLLPVGFAAFWRKDIVVPYSREPKRYLFHQVNVLWWGLMTVVLAMALRDRGNISVALADTMPVLMTLLAMAVIAMQNGINALGREGTELTWLRPVLSGWQLFLRKLFVNLVYALVHGIAYAIVISAASQAASLGTSPLSLFAYAICTGIGFACFANAIGFLLPDFERKRSSLPGSTVIGKTVFLFGALVLVAICGAAHLLLEAGVFERATYAGLLAFAGISATLCCVVFSAAALRQYRGLEI